jgi:hypothetical protein
MEQLKVVYALIQQHLEAVKKNAFLCRYQKIQADFY